MIRAIVYTRVSTAEQDATNQDADLKRLAAARGWSIVDVVVESASAAGARPAFAAMLKRARRGDCNVIAVWSLDRFGRSMTGNIRDVLELERVGVRVVSVREEWLDTTGPVRDLLLAIFSWIAEQERRRIGERTKAGMDRARAEGKAIGRPRARIDQNHLELEIAKWPARARKRVRGIARALGVSETTVRRELERRKGTLAAKPPASRQKGIAAEPHSTPRNRKRRSP